MGEGEGADHPQARNIAKPSACGNNHELGDRHMNVGLGEQSRQVEPPRNDRFRTLLP